jgi:hypothetical protein
VFSLGQLVVSAVGGVLVSVIALFIYQKIAKSDGVDSSLWPLPFVVGVSIFVWRAAGNTPGLNDDPIAFVSPNDVLCPVITYVSLGLCAGFGRMSERADRRRIRALLTIVSLVVNVVTI